MNEQTQRFNLEIAQEISDSLVEILNSYKGVHAVEKIYAIAAVLRTLGATLYDRSDKSYEAVLQDYKTSPTWPAALILISHLPHEIRELLLREKNNPEENDKLWKKHEENIVNGRW